MANTLGAGVLAPGFATNKKGAAVKTPFIKGAINIGKLPAGTKAAIKAPKIVTAGPSNNGPKGIKPPAALKIPKAAKNPLLTPLQAKSAGKIEKAYNFNLAHTPASVKNIPMGKPQVSGVPSSVLGTLGSLASNAGSDAVSLGSGLANFLPTVATAVGHDATHPAGLAKTGLGIVTGNPSLLKSSAVGNIGVHAVTGDPIFQAVTHGSINPIMKHPLYTAMDLTGVDALLGKAADIAHAADTSRELSLEGSGFKVTKEGPKGLTARQLVKHAEANPNGNAARIVKLGKTVSHPIQAAKGQSDLEAEMAKRVDAHTSMGPSVERHTIATINKRLKAVEPKTDAAKNLVGHIMAAGHHGDLGIVRQDLLDRGARLAQFRDAVEANPQEHGLMPSDLGTLNKNIEDLSKASSMSDEELGSAVKSADVHAQIAHELDLHKQAIGLHAAQQVAKRSVTNYALEHMGAQILPERRLTSEGVQIKSLEKDMKSHSDAIKSLREQKRGADTAVKKGKISRLIEGHKADLKDLTAEHNDLKLGQKTVRGLALPVEKANPADILKSGKAAGASDNAAAFRPLGTPEILQHMEEHGYAPESSAYLNMRGEDEPGMENIAGQKPGTTPPGRGGSTKRYLGLNFERGLYGGTAEDARTSLMGQAKQASRADQHDRMIQELTVPMKSTNPTDLAWEKHAYEQEHGIPMEVVRTHAADVGDEHLTAAAQHNEGEQYAMRPKVVGDQIRAHEKATNAESSPARVVGTTFRKAILPYSANYLQSVFQESLLRGLANGVNPLRTGAATKMLSHMESMVHDASLPAAERVQWQRALNEMEVHSHTGQIFSQAKRYEDATVPNKIAMLSKIERAYKLIDRNPIAQGTQKAARAIEQHFSKAVMDKTVRGMMKDINGSIEDVSTEHLDPNVRNATGNEINRVLGKYNNLTPAERKLVSNYAPFLSWLKNSYGFIYRDLWRDHPVQGAIYRNVGANNGTAGPGTYSYGFLGGKFDPSRYTIPSPFGGTMDLSRNSPFGAGEASPLQNMSIMMPLETGVVYGIAGDNAYGQAPNGKYGATIAPGSTGALEQVGKNVEGSIIPAYGVISRIDKALTGGYEGNPYANAAREAFGGAISKPVSVPKTSSKSATSGFANGTSTSSSKSGWANGSTSSSSSGWAN